MLPSWPLYASLAWRLYTYYAIPCCRVLWMMYQSVTVHKFMPVIEYTIAYRCHNIMTVLGQSNLSQIMNICGTLAAAHLLSQPCTCSDRVSLVIYYHISDSVSSFHIMLLHKYLKILHRNVRIVVTLTHFHHVLYLVELFNLIALFTCSYVTIML